MTRLQKKCLIAAAGTHLLVVVVVLCSGFITSQPKQDDTQVLEMLPSVVMDNVLNSGSKNAPTPPPTPIIKPPEPTPPIPDPPKPEVKPPPQPKPEPEPVKLPDPVKPVDNPEIPIPKPPKKHEVKVDLKPVVRDNKQAAQEATEAAKKAALEEKKLRDQRLKAFQNAARSIKENSSKATVVDASPGTGSVSYANYASVVKSRYDGAWTPPDDMASDDVTTKVSVTISRDGTVVSARIIGRSGEARVDASVQRALDRVDFIAPFPEGAKEKERTFIINFNPQARRLNG